MRLTGRASLRTVAGAVGDTLRRHGIKTVLTGGACATLYTRGAFPSLDMDFVLIGGTTQARLDGAMAAAGFGRRGDRYVHPRLPFWVEFPRGPIAIGRDYRIRPVVRRVRSGRLQMLSPTDSCRDRLAAFYHWNDRQSLDAAVEIARLNRVRLETVRRWSLAERAREGYAEFLRELRRARARKRRVHRSV